VRLTKIDGLPLIIRSDQIAAVDEFPAGQTQITLVSGVIIDGASNIQVQESVEDVARLKTQEDAK
jgi:uncharacterized protein YlzI (FlbEa/FlbD family)